MNTNWLKDKILRPLVTTIAASSMLSEARACYDQEGYDNCMQGATDAYNIMIEDCAEIWAYPNAPAENEPYYNECLASAEIQRLQWDFECHSSWCFC